MTQLERVELVPKPDKLGDQIYLSEGGGGGRFMTAHCSFQVHKFVNSNMDLPRIHVCVIKFIFL